ncbi:hypothetical protein MMC2321_02634 [Chitinophaga sp. MM2321]
MVRLQEIITTNIVFFPSSKHAIKILQPDPCTPYKTTTCVKSRNLQMTSPSAPCEPYIQIMMMDEL